MASIMAKVPPGGVITNTGSITTTGGGAGDASVYVHGNGDGTIVNNSGTMSSASMASISTRHVPKAIRSITRPGAHFGQHGGGD
ncbi:ShdA [Salmonella enterica subsp. enterica]|uniref:ShdA n=1 Tax=Salmonella enterica I TaxID=59201 RepID=A0A379WR92_SALET|nr:ShdA [Salmonella enterica subsp. enterica]